MVRVSADVSKTNRKMVPLTRNTKYFISLLQKLIDLRAVAAGLFLITMKNVVNIYSRLSQISSMSCVPDSLFYCLMCKKSCAVNTVFFYKQRCKQRNSSL